MGFIVRLRLRSRLNTYPLSYGRLKPLLFYWIQGTNQKVKVLQGKKEQELFDETQGKTPILFVSWATILDIWREWSKALPYSISTKYRSERALLHSCGMRARQTRTLGVSSNISCFLPYRRELVSVQSFKKWGEERSFFFYFFVKKMKEFWRCVLSFSRVKSGCACFLSFSKERRWFFFFYFFF